MITFKQEGRFFVYGEIWTDFNFAILRLTWDFERKSTEEKIDIVGITTIDFSGILQ